MGSRMRYHGGRSALSRTSKHELNPKALVDLDRELDAVLARARKATEELPPLEELAALQEAMLGLAEMGALLTGMRVASQRAGEAVEKPPEGPEHPDPDAA